MARKAMFNVAGGRRLQGVISKAAAKQFETHRRNLALTAHAAIEWTGPVSDAAVIEYLARGLKGTIEYWKKGKK